MWLKFKRSSSRQQSSRQMSWDAPEFVLATLKDAAKLTPVPYLQDAAGVALRIIQIIQDVKSNKQAFQRLANDAGALVYIILCNGNRDTTGAAGFTPAYLDHSRELLETLHDIYNYTKSRASRNRLVRIIQHQSDAGTIQEYRDRLKQSLDVFNLKSSISIQGTLASMKEQLTQMLEHTKHQQEQGKRREQAGTADEGRTASDEIDEGSKRAESPKEVGKQVWEEIAEETRSGVSPNRAETRGEPSRQNEDHGHRPAPSTSTSNPFRQHHSYYSEQPSTSSQSGYYHPYPQSFYGATPPGIPPGSPPLGPAFHPGLQSPIPGIQFSSGSFTSVGGDQNTYTNSVVTSHVGDTTTYNVSNSDNDISSRNYRGRARRR